MKIEIDPKETIDINNPNIRFSRVSEGFAKEHPEVVKVISKHQLIYSLVGLLLGLICLVGGIALFLLGITQQSKWVANILGSTSEITDAAPGAILFIIGLFMVVVTRYQMRVTSNKG